MTARDIIKAKYPMGDEEKILGIQSDITMWTPFPERPRVIEAQSILTNAQNSISSQFIPHIAKLLEVDEYLVNKMEQYECVL